MRKILLAALMTAALLAIVFAGCTERESGGFKITIMDQAGNSVTIEGNVEKIVSLSPSITEILFAINLGEKIVGIDDASDFPSDTDDIAKVSSWEGLDLEKIVALQPDLVLMDKTLDMSGDRYTALTGAGLTVYLTFPHNLDEVMESIKAIGKITENEDVANSYVGELEKRVDDVEEKGSAVSDKPKILYVTYYDGTSSPWVGTDKTFSGDLIDKAGGKNVVSDSTGIVIQIDVEEIVSQNPDIIITSQSLTWPTQSRELILNDEKLKDVNAVKEGRVYDINGDLIDRPGPRIVNGLEELYDHVEAYGA